MIQQAIATQTVNCTVLNPVNVSMSTNGVDAVINVFLSYQDVNHGTPSTYRRALSQFFGWVRDTGRTPAALSRADVLQFKQDMKNAGYSPNTINSYLTAVRRFYTFCELYGIAPNIAKEIKNARTSSTTEHEKDGFTARQAGGILNATEGNKRDFAILSVMLRCGLRCIEITRANIGDIVLNGETYILTVRGKGDKVRRVPLTPKTWESINDYLTSERRGAKPNDPLFTSNAHQCKGGRMATASISRMAKKAIRAIGINDNRHTAHSCRHATACLIYSESRDLDRVQQLLGHTDPKTTQIYAREAMNADYFRNAPNTVLDELF